MLVGSTVSHFATLYVMDYLSGIYLFEFPDSDLVINIENMVKEEKYVDIIQGKFFDVRN